MAHLFYTFQPTKKNRSFFFLDLKKIPDEDFNLKMKKPVGKPLFRNKQKALNIVLGYVLDYKAVIIKRSSGEQLYTHVSRFRKKWGMEKLEFMARELLNDGEIYCYHNALHDWEGDKK